MEKLVGRWSFIIGVILAIIIGLIGGMLGELGPWLASLLILAGLIVGFLNVSGEDTKDFMIAGIVLIIAAYMGNAADTLTSIEFIGVYISSVFSSIMAFVVPAMIIVALRDVYELARP